MARTRTPRPRERASATACRASSTVAHRRGERRLQVHVGVVGRRRLGVVQRPGLGPRERHASDRSAGAAYVSLHGRIRSMAPAAARTSPSAPSAAHDLHADGQAVDLPRRDRGRGMPGEVRGIGQRPADRPVDLHALDDVGERDLTRGAGVLHREAPDRRRDQQVVVREHALQHVVDLGPRGLQPDVLAHRHRPCLVQPAQEVRGKLRAVVGEQVDAGGGEAVHALQRGRGDEPAPRLRQLELIARQRERHAVDGRAGGAQVVHRVLDDRRDTPVDRDSPEVGAVGDPHAHDGAPAVSLEVRGAEHRVRVARVRARQHRQPERDVRDRPGHEPLEHERRGRRTGSGASRAAHGRATA